ncbi:MAG TPA: hypothetical protein VLM11_16170 [Streptosporangiaceae bacterium]|nr:hypothetical protein [Streptosporangiaceae bacterium]
MGTRTPDLLHAIFRPGHPGTSVTWIATMLGIHGNAMLPGLVGVKSGVRFRVALVVVALGSG